MRSVSDTNLGATTRERATTRKIPRVSTLPPRTLARCSRCPPSGRRRRRGPIRPRVAGTKRAALCSMPRVTIRWRTTAHADAARGAPLHAMIVRSFLRRRLAPLSIACPLDRGFKRV
jgi:hypothetical protein